MPSPFTPEVIKVSPAKLERAKSRPQTTQNTPQGTPFKLSKSFELDRLQRGVEAKVLQWQKLEEGQHDTSKDRSGSPAGRKDKEHTRALSGSPRPRVKSSKSEEDGQLRAGSSDGWEGKSKDGVRDVPIEVEKVAPELPIEVQKINRVPKKRIISDEHWMKDREGDKDDKLKAQTLKPRRSAKMGGIDIGPMNGSKKVDAWIRRKPPPRPPSPPKPEELEPQPPKTSTNELLLKYLTGSKGKIDKIKADHAARVARDDVPEPQGRQMDKFLSALDVEPTPTRKASWNKEKEPASNGSSTERSITPPRPYTSRLDSWLGDTPDPFTESPNRLHKSAKRRASVVASESLRSSSEEPSAIELEVPRQRSRREERHSRHESYEDKHSRRKAQEDEQTFRDYDVTLEEPQSPTQGLRRRGATRTNASPERKRERTKSQSVVTSELGPYDSISMRNEPRARPSPKSAERHSSRRQRALSVIESVDTATQNTSAGQQEKQLAVVEDGVVRASSAESVADGSEKKNSLTRKLTTHEDLMSVLSQPVSRGKSIKSACNLNKPQTQQQSGSVKEVMDGFQADEAAYSRELRTLVDGVIPVLLSCVLSRSNSAKAAGLFTGRSNNTNTVTGPIVQMGVALERLKSLHRRVPLTNPSALITWANSAQRAYEEYFKVWRLGFQDVVVNLAPATDATPKVQKLNTGWDEGLPQNDDGFVVGGDGEKVDVASLLKRPLFRVKTIAATLSAIGQLESSESADLAAQKFQDLTAEARKRHREERARLEDEAAAEIDATRARAPESLAPLRDVRIDPSRCVRARDYFDLSIPHSSGQKIDCKAELIIRDDHPDQGGAPGDILICEVDEKARWLLLPPIRFSQVSARNGNTSNQAVLMIRGMTTGGAEWSELLTLHSLDGNIVSEWMGMLATTPVPPEIKAEKNNRQSTRTLATIAQHATPLKMLKAQDDDTHVPLGEQASEISSRWTPRQGSLSPTRRSVMSSTVSSSNTDASSYARSDSSPTASREKLGLRPTSSHYDGDHNRASTIGRHRFGDPAYTSTISHSAPSTPSGMRHNSNSRHNNDIPSTPEKRARFSNTPSTLPNTSQYGQHEPRSAPHKRTSPQTPTKEQSFPSLAHSPAPNLSPTSPGQQLRRRSSSPLKHEYQPSDESDSSSLHNDFLSDDDDAESIWSEISADDTLGPLPPVPNHKQRPPARGPPSSYHYNKQSTLTPSQSASQDPYRTVPNGDGPGSKKIASIFSWSDKGLWESLHPSECSIVVTAGLIEAFELTAEHSKDIHDPERPRPLVALELTPLVPLRKGTAIDITVRSPPNPTSLIRKGNNIMFRSRNNQECDELYNLINQARINNPTYIALQNARGPESGWGQYMDRRAQERANGIVSSWWRFGSRKGSYRAKSTRRTLSVSGQSESSVGTVSSTMSALKRLSGGSRLFDVAKSTIMSRRNRSKPSTSLNSSSTGSGSGEVGSRKASTDMRGPVGIRTTKIRFYQREGLGKWRDMGAARLAILHPEQPSVSQPNVPTSLHRRAMSESAAGAPPTVTRPSSPVRTPGSKSEKRILVTGKTAGETLLDATLSETAFERVARTGIAINVWAHTGMVGSTGGVTTATMRVYMVQMRSEAEAAYTFSLVGRLRY